MAEGNGIGCDDAYGRGTRAFIPDDAVVAGSRVVSEDSGLLVIGLLSVKED